MSNLTPNPGKNDIYRIESTDPVQGHDSTTGVDGIANRQAQELLNRMEHLRGTALRVGDNESINPIDLSNSEGKLLAVAGGQITSVLPADGSASDVLIEFAKSTGFSLVGQIKSFSDLRTVTPTQVGQRVLLSGYYSGSSLGGGEFEAISNSGLTDDSGVIAVVSDEWAWRRVLPTEQLNVVHFGAVPDGISDCTSAMKLMHEYSQNNDPHLGIQFPAGNFRMIAGLDLSDVYTSRFRISGPATRFGYLPQTTIIVDSATDGFAVLVNARFTEVSNVIIEGEIDKSTSGRGFFKNICEAGQYVRGSCIHSKNMGGKSFSLLDTLDTKFDQFYASACTASFLYTTWSNNSSGTWDHVTAIELTNFNIQSCTTEPAIDCVRATQSLIRNGWIERCEYPGNISEGQWIIDALSLEVNTNPFQAQYCRLIKSQINLQGSTIDYESGASSENIPSWVNSVYESGSVDISNNSLSVIGGLSSTFQYSKNRITNMAGSAKWVKLGRVYNPQTGSTAIIKLLGTRGLESIAGNSPEGTAFGAGETFINIQNKGDNSKLRVSWYAVGSSPLRSVKYVPASTTTTDIYVQVGPYTGEVGVFAESSNLSRAEAGLHFYFSPDMSVISDITTVSGTIDAPSKFSVNNGTYGLGMNFDTGTMLYAGRLENSKIPIIINGVTYFISVSTS